MANTNAALLAAAHKLSYDPARPSTPRGLAAWDPQEPAAANELVMTEEDVCWPVRVTGFRFLNLPAR